VREIEESLVKQIEVLQDVGLSDTPYYKALSNFSYDKEIIKDRRVKKPKKKK